MTMTDEDELWGAVAGPHKYGVTLRLPGHADAAMRLKAVSLRAPGTGFLETPRGPCAIRADGGDLLVHIPMDIAEQFDPDTPYLLEIPELGLTGSVESWPAPAATGPTLEELMQGLNAPTPAPKPPTPPSPTPETPAPAAAATAIPVMGSFHLPDRNRRRAIFWALAGALLLFFVLPLLLGWLFWGRIFHHDPTPTTPSAKGNPGMLAGLDGGLHAPPKTAVPATTAVHPLTEPTTASTPEKTPEKKPATPVRNGDLGLLSVPEVIRQAPDTAAIRQEGDRRLTNGHPDDGVLLLEAAAKRGDSTAQLDLAHLYDPTRFKEGSPLPAPDMRESADYYRQAVKNGAQAAPADRAALQDYLKKLIASGDNPAASGTLKDYWP
ncbi:hypothetical protein [Oecophyllibacter saccharovorans]|uniref:hypothetical protein n=1 Tax=Oecophyllibacter saccharovorans TaxID=2558360 RepID=UPI00116BE83E|nr:hypothetical protein [Oecophyllibacter saccharovorans]TPW36324.1 hypothetical protein E3203_00560 [Oecophyllibacter saccharovorans]